MTGQRSTLASITRRACPRAGSALGVFPLPVLLVVIIIAAMACDRLPTGYTSIADLQRAPGEYEGKTVKVRGQVADVVKLPLPDLRYYVLRDGDAEITVFGSGTLPAVNTQVSVVGTVHSPAIIGGVGIGLHLTEQRHW